MKRTFNKAWCMFEQSGTFKNEFIKLGIPAVDLDIQNNFGETDYVIDLFAEIDKEYAILQREREKIQSSHRLVKTILLWLFSPAFILQAGPTLFILLLNVLTIVASLLWGSLIKCLREPITEIIFLK